MKIVDVTWTPVFARFHRPEVWTWSRREGMTSLIIEIHTDEGVQGIGECAAWPSVGLADLALRSTKEVIVGENPLDVEPLWRRAKVLPGWRHASPAGNTALSGIEMALWDIVGKVAGMPLSRLFGGAVRTRIEYFYYLMRGEPDEVAREAKAAVESGFRTLYIKIGITKESDLELVAAIRDAIGPGVSLRIDPNEAWAFGTAKEMMRRFEAFDIELLEQPTVASNHQELRHIRETVGVPILANESSWDERDVVECLRSGSADVISLDHQMLGSLVLLRRMAHMCESWGYPVLKHSFGEFGIATAGAMHVIATCPNFLYANQSYASVLLDDVVSSPNMLCRDGFLEVPTKPGLGVELDRDKLELLAEQYQREKMATGWDAVWPSDVPAVPRY